MKLTRSLIVVTLFALLLAACAPQATPTPVMTEEPPAPAPAATPEPTAAPQTIVDVALADGRFTTLAAALGAAGLVETLQGEGPFTVFAPTDDAFAALPEGTVEALLNDIPALTDILLFHVAEGEIAASTIVDSGSVATLQGEEARVKVEGGTIFVAGAEVISSDIQTANGVIHVIDAVMLPGQTNTIVDAAVADGRFTTLVAALEAAGLVETLQGEGPFTVFAPTDDAFAALPEGTVDALLADIPQLTSILTYHVVAGKFMAADVLGLPYADTVQGQPVLFRVQDGNVFVNNAQVVITDIETDNGVIHVIDAVILPPSLDIVDTAVADGRFTTLAVALEAAGLIETLKSEGPFTVFAPTDDAFAKLPAGTIEALLADIPQLTSILSYHVVSGRVLAADVVSLTSATTVQGADVTIRVEDGNVFINDAQVIITDILTTNGVIHVIDTVILPPAE